MSTRFSYDIRADDLALGLVCKLCVWNRWENHFPPDIELQPRFSTSEELRKHWDVVHRVPFQGYERAWVGALEEARGLSAGYLVCSGDWECTFHKIWCLHCDHWTSDPVLVTERICPKCGRNYASLTQNKITYGARTGR